MCVFSLNGELDEKNSHISKLRNKLSRVQKKYQVASSDLGSEAGDLDRNDLDRRPSDVGQVNRRPSELGSVTASFTDHGGHSNGNHKTEYHTQVSGSRGTPSGGSTPQRKVSSEQAGWYRGQHGTDGDRAGIEDRQKREIMVIQGQLQASQDLNDALKKELAVYEALHRETQGAPLSDGGLNLKEHLEEIRRLRLRLEESIEQNNRLKETLERQLTEIGGNRGEYS